MENLIQEFKNQMAGFSKIYIADTIRVDYFLHALFGQLIYVVIRRFKFPPMIAYIIVIFLALAKEFYDSFTLQNEFTENITDFGLSIIFPTLSVIIFNKVVSKNKLN